MDEEGAGPAHALRAESEADRFEVVVPRLIFLEVLNVAARKWLWGHEELHDLVDALGDVPLVVRDPDMRGVAEWAARGLTVYDAVYVALAEELFAPLVTTDGEILTVAAGIAKRLA